MKLLKLCLLLLVALLAACGQTTNPTLSKPEEKTLSTLAVTPLTVTGWGNNFNGQINIPAGLTDVIAIAAGGGHSLALKSDGTVVGWGADLAGQATVPAGLSGVTAISAGWSTSMALKSDGTVVAWGWNYHGQTTVPANLTNVKAIAMSEYYALALKNDGTMVGWGDNTLRQLNFPSGPSNVIAIAAGQGHTLALKSDGTVVGWGNNVLGQLNIPSGLSNVIAISSTGWHNLALKSDGTVVAWGYNQGNGGGQATVPAGLSNVIAIAAGRAHSLALKSDGTVVAWGGQATPPAGLSRVAAISGGASHSLALTSDGTPPTASPSVSSGTAGSNSWYTSDVSVNWNWSDEAGGSGIDTANCTSSSTSSGEGTLNLIATCKDNAGNQGSATTTVKIDKTAPTVSGTVVPNPVLRYLSAVATPSASDNLSGVVSSSCAAVNTSSLGSFTTPCTAIDNAGNAGTGSAPYTVISASTAIGNLIPQLQGLGLSPGLLNSLTNLLRGAQADLVARNRTSAGRTQPLQRWPPI
jgi:hypothetical protein